MRAAAQLQKPSPPNRNFIAAEVAQRGPTSSLVFRSLCLALLNQASRSLVWMLRGVCSLVGAILHGVLWCIWNWWFFYCSGQEFLYLAYLLCVYICALMCDIAVLLPVMALIHAFTLPPLLHSALGFAACVEYGRWGREYIWGPELYIVHG
jgi:hypothetical protein